MDQQVRPSEAPSSRLARKLTGRPEYARNLDVAAAASLLGPMRRGIAVSCWAYAVGVVLLMLSPAGPASTAATVFMGAAGAVSAVLGCLWWRRGWPSAHFSVAFLIYSELCHTGVLLATTSPMLALIATLWFALVGEHITLAHGRRAVAAHALWALANIAFFATQATRRSNASVPLIVYAAFALVGLIVAIPVLRQLGADALRDDSRRAAALAERDSLTSLLNHRGMYAALPALLLDGRVTDEQLAVVVIDLDRFKSINDRYGHHRGDQVLRLVAARLSGCVRRGAVVARTGGEEFIVIDTVAPDGAAALAHRLLRAIHRQHDDVPVTASLGVSSVPLREVAVERLTQDVQELITLSDSTMYRAKRDGGNQVRVSEPAGRTSERATTAPPDPTAAAPAERDSGRPGRSEDA
jgi:diguanylate cyclase (GGDEF)-like protein